MKPYGSERSFLCTMLLLFTLNHRIARYRFVSPITVRDFHMKIYDISSYHASSLKLCAENKHLFSHFENTLHWHQN